MSQLIMAGAVMNFLEFALIVGHSGGAERLYREWVIFNNTSTLQNNDPFGPLQASKCGTVCAFEKALGYPRRCAHSIR